MSSSDSTVFWSRRPQISICLEGNNAILFDPDTGREKVINHTGQTIWGAMDGAARMDDLAAALAKRHEIILTDEVCADASAFAEELRRDGYAATAGTPSPEPVEAEAYSWIHEAPRSFDLSLTGRCNLKCAYCFYADEMAGRQDLMVATKLAAAEQAVMELLAAVRSLADDGGDPWDIKQKLKPARRHR